MANSPSIQTFHEINDLHAASGYAGRTDLPLFHVFPLDRDCEAVRAYMPPHRRGFYQASLLLASHGVSFALDAPARAVNHNLLLFAAPRQVLSWTRSPTQSGWVVYFKPGFLDLTDVQIERRFSFFQPGAINVQPVPEHLRERLHGYCIQICSSFEEKQPYRRDVLRGLFTAFLFECLALYTSNSNVRALKSSTEALFWRFRHLLDRNFLTHRSVAQYARLMRITPGHLTEVVRQASGRAASQLIAERVFFEARQLLSQGDLTISSISAHLQFSEPTHFTRFFKRQAACTPRQFRDSGYSTRDSG